MAIPRFRGSARGGCVRSASVSAHFSINIRACVCRPLKSARRGGITERDVLPSCHFSFARSFIMRSKTGIVAPLVVVGIAAFAAGLSVGQEKKVNTRLYELRTYTALPGRLPALHKRFAEHTIKLFEKHGMKNEMYWVPTDPAKKDNTLIYVVSHDSQEAADKSWKGFVADPDWHKARDASEADGKIVEKVERVYMTLTDYSPGK
jgi:hypothetical protein